MGASAERPDNLEVKRELLAIDALRAVDHFDEPRFPDVERRLHETADDELSFSERFTFRTGTGDLTYSPEFRVGLDEAVLRDWIDLTRGNLTLEISEQGRDKLAELAAAA